MRSAANSWFFETVEATALAPGAASAPALVERSAPAGAMAPLYRRDEDEAYRVTSGEITFFVDGEPVRAQTGDVVVAPARVARTFRVESNYATWLVLTRVASLARYEDFARAVAQPARDGWAAAPEELAALRAIGAANGIEILAAPGSVALVA